MSAETESVHSTLRSKLKVKRPLLFRRRSGASTLSDQPLGSMPAVPATMAALRTANSTPLARERQAGPFSPPLVSATPTDTVPVLPPLPSDLPSDFDAPRYAAAMIVPHATLALMQLAPVNMSGLMGKEEKRPSISTAGRSTSPPAPVASVAEALTSQSSLAESKEPSIHSSAFHVPSMPPSASFSTLFSGEQLSASTLTMPVTSFAALYRTFRNLEWITNHAPQMREVSDALLSHQDPLDATDAELTSSFDLSILVQATADSLAAQAAQQGVELILHHKSTASQDHKQATVQMEGGIAEVLVRADESLTMLALVALLQEMLMDCPPGSSIEIALSADASAPLSSLGHEDDGASAMTVESSMVGESSRSWNVAIDLVRTMPRNVDLTAASSPAQVACLKQVSATLTHLAGFAIVDGDSPTSSNRLMKRVQAVLPASSSSVKRTRRGSLEPQREPSRTELINFAETSLKGKKVVFHASERSLFAKHVTNFFASWGTDISYSSTDLPEEMPSPSSMGKTDDGHVRYALGRYDSGFASASESSPSYGPAMSPAEQVPPLPSSHRVSPIMPDAPAIDPSISFIVIDDDVPTLKRQLTAIRNNPPIQPHMSSTLLSKRPQLQSRRTRSSAAIRQAGVSTPLSVVYFTSVANFRTIREVVRGILRVASPMLPLPDVLVVPKPIGPRRLLTVLHTALKRPSLDPAFAPIATSPASPGGHYFFAGGATSPRASPAASAADRHFDFTEVGVAEETASQTEAEQPGVLARALSAHSSGSGRGSASVAGTPPFLVAPTQPGGQPTPIGGSEALEYFSSTAATLSAGGASSGIVIQSPDGRPTGLFFQPAAKRTPSGHIRAVDADGQSTAASSAMPKEGENKSAESDISLAVRTPTADVEEDVELPRIRQVDTFDVELPTLRQLDTFATIAEEIERSPLPSPSGSESETNGDPGVTADDLGLVTPQHLGLGQVGRAASDPVGMQTVPKGSSSPPLRAVRLESYALPSPADSLQAPVPPPLHRMSTAPAKITIVPTLALPSTPRRPSATRQGTQTTPPSAVSPTPGTPRATFTDAATPPALSQPVLSEAMSTASSTMLPAVQETTAAPPMRSRKISSRGSSNRKRVKALKKPDGGVLLPIKVLIVEDNRINQQILATFMKRRNIGYGVASNGQEAVDMWKTGGYHLVLMDIQLPIKSGIEATMEIRELERHHDVGSLVSTPTAETPTPFSSGTSASSPYGLPVIIVALTASSDSADRVAALAAGCNDFLTKPVGLVWLQQKLLEWGSMQLLAGFPRRQINRAAVPPTTKQQIDAAAHRVAAALHLESSVAMRTASGSETIDSIATSVETDSNDTTEHVIAPTTT